MSLKNVTREDVQKLLIKTSPSKATGLDGIPARFVRDGAEVILDPITHILNLSINQSKLPHDLKMARVLPILKKTTNQNPVITGLYPY